MPVLDLATLTTRYRSVYHEFTSWEALAARMLADPYDADTLTLLMAELREHGRFRQPVVLGLYEEWDLGDTDDDEDILTASYDAVLDGTHRVCAHLLAGVQEVVVAYEADEADSAIGGFAVDETDPTYYLIMSSQIEAPLPLTAVAPAHVVAKADFDEREADLDLWEALMSLRLDDQVWLTSPTSGSSREADVLHYSITWDAQAFRVMPDTITAAVRAKLNRFGYDTSGFTITTVLEDMAGDVPMPVDAGVVLANLRSAD